MIKLHFRKFDFVDIWRWNYRDKEYSLYFYSPTQSNKNCWFDKFTFFDNGEMTTYLYFLWMKVEITQKIKPNRHTLEMYENIARRLPSKERHELNLKLIEARYCELLNILEFCEALALEDRDNIEYSAIEIKQMKTELDLIEDLINLYDAICKDVNNGK
jgi:hypothetical protein